ncbi:MAG: exodeoxyribonuclease VII small subunit [Pseudonocardiaceae bacterium]
MADRDDPATLGYEAARDELTEVVRKLEAGGLSLEDSLALWERGEQLAAACEQHLVGARERIESVITARELRDAEPPVT